jgi:hypothetical protein
MPLPSRMFEVGQCATPVLRCAERPISSGRGMHHVRVPHVVAEPAELLREFDRAAAVTLEAVAFLVERFGEVRVRVHAVAARERDALAHQIGRDGERRTRRDDDARHREAAGIVVRLDRALRVGHDRAFVLDAFVRRQAALRAPDRHRAARGVEAQPDLARDLDLVVDAAAVRPHVGVVARGRAAREQQLRARDRGRAAQRFGPQPGPDRIEGDQPVEQRDVLRARHRARERLIEVVVRVDEARNDDAAARIDDAVGFARQVVPPFRALRSRCRARRSNRRYRWSRRRRRSRSAPHRGSATSPSRLACSMTTLEYLNAANEESFVSAIGFRVRRFALDRARRRRAAAVRGCRGAARGDGRRRPSGGPGQRRSR